jgi:hypothetical protein
MTPATRRTTVLLRLAAAALALATMPACITMRGNAPRRDQAVTATKFDREAAIEKAGGTAAVDENANAFADRFRTLLGDATEEILARTTDARKRAIIQTLLVDSTMSLYDIATNGEPFSQVLDMTIVVTLTSQIWIDEGRAIELLGPEDAKPLIRALREARREVWNLAAELTAPEMLAQLDFMIASWRRSNPGVEEVAWVRLSDFAKLRGSSLVTESAGNIGLFDGLEAGLAQAKSYELLMNRIFYLSKRAPTLLGWQSQAALDAVLAREEIQRVLANLESSTKAANDAAATAGKLADELPQLVQREREAIFAELDRRQADVDSSLAKVNAIAADARAATADVKATLEGVSPLLEKTEPTLAAVQKLAETSERILAKVAEIKGPDVPPDPNAPPAKPVTVDDVKEALAAATGTLEQANALLERGESLGDSPAIKGLIDEITHATEQRIQSLEESVARLLWLAAGLVAGLAALVFVLVMVARKAGRTARSGGAA